MQWSGRKQKWWQSTAFLITQMGILRAVKTYLNYILRSCMDVNSNYSYTCMTSSSLIRVMSCIDMLDMPLCPGLLLLWPVLLSLQTQGLQIIFESLKTLVWLLLTFRRNAPILKLKIVEYFQSTMKWTVRENYSTHFSIKKWCVCATSSVSHSLYFFK